jgi:hypothetical protein
MQLRIKLKDLKIGKIDAKNELIDESESSIQQFKKSYVIPPTIDIEPFLKKEVYFVTGLKGAGKTALLRFISLELEEKYNHYSRFFLFKSEFDEDIKKEFSKLQSKNKTHAELHENNDLEDEDSYKSYWRWFIYKKIIEFQNENSHIEIFQKNSDWSKFVDLVDSINEEKKSFKRFFPKLKRGRVVVNKNPTIEAEFEPRDSTIIEIEFSDLINSIDNKFERLIAGSDCLNLFFDELELSHFKNKQYEKDARLIRDLIKTIEKINNISRKKRIFYLYI